MDGSLDAGAWPQKRVFWMSWERAGCLKGPLLSCWAVSKKEVVGSTCAHHQPRKVLRQGDHPLPDVLRLHFQRRCGVRVRHVEVQAVGGDDDLSGVIFDDAPVRRALVHDLEDQSAGVLQKGSALTSRILGSLAKKAGQSGGRAMYAALTCSGLRAFRIPSRLHVALVGDVRLHCRARERVLGQEPAPVKVLGGAQDRLHFAVPGVVLDLVRRGVPVGARPPRPRTE